MVHSSKTALKKHYLITEQNLIILKPDIRNARAIMHVQDA